MSSLFPSITIEDLSPLIDGGRVPIKRILHQRVKIEATIYKEGHESVRALLKWRLKNSPIQMLHADCRQKQSQFGEICQYAHLTKDSSGLPAATVDQHERSEQAWQEVPMEQLDNYRFRAFFQVTSLGLIEYTIEAWGDPFDSWVAEVQKKNRIKESRSTSRNPRRIASDSSNNKAVQ